MFHLDRKTTNMRHTDKPISARKKNSKAKWSPGICAGILGDRGWGRGRYREGSIRNPGKRVAKALALQREVRIAKTGECSYSKDPKCKMLWSPKLSEHQCDATSGKCYAWPPEKTVKACTLKILYKITFRLYKVYMKYKWILTWVPTGRYLILYANIPKSENNMKS